MGARVGDNTVVGVGVEVKVVDGRGVLTGSFVRVKVLVGRGVSTGVRVGV